MNQRRENLLTIVCLLVLLVPTAWAQTAGAQNAVSRSTIPKGFVPKHLQMQRLQGPSRRPKQNPFQQPIASIPTAITQEVGSDTAVANSASTSASAGEVVRPVNHESLMGVGEGNYILDPSSGMPAMQPACGVPSFHQAAACPSVFWMSADYLLWSTRKADSPALASTSVAGTLREAAGVLDEPGVSTLFGGGGLNGDMRSGARFTLGGWFNARQDTGIQISYLALEEDEETFLGSSSDFPILARPFYNTGLFEEDSRLINFPDLVRGDLSIRSTSEFDSLEVMFLAPLAQDDCGRSVIMVGYRNANLDELLRVDETTVSLVSPTLNSTFELFDEFETENSFHGYQIAAQYSGTLSSCWSYDLIGKAAIGSSRNQLSIRGQTITTTDNGDVSTSPEGLLALESNSGSRTEYEFSSLFELGINLRRCFANGWQFRVGYNYLHWSSVLRAAEQVDRDITPTEVPPGTRVGPVKPSALFAQSGFWAQGLNLGIEYRF